MPYFLNRQVLAISLSRPSPTLAAAKVANSISIVYLLPNHVTNTTTQVRHVGIVLLFSFFFASETMTV